MMNVGGRAAKAVYIFSYEEVAVGRWLRRLLVIDEIAPMCLLTFSTGRESTSRRVASPARRLLELPEGTGPNRPTSPSAPRGSSPAGFTHHAGRS
jgi:hypothetical protein